MGSAEAEKAKVEQKLQTLQFQNGKLSAQLEVQRSQIAELETRIEAQDAKQSSYADTLLTVNSLWSQLNADIQHLGTRASKGPGHETANSDVAQLDGAAAAADACAAPDPYLRVLLHGDAAAMKEAEERKQDVHDFASDVERQLRARTASTSAALAELLQQVDDARKASAEASGPVDAVARVSELEAECRRMTAAVDAGTALRRALDQQLQQANSQAMKQEAQIKELQNDLADRCEELRAAQRKLVMARTSSNAAAMETAGPQPVPATPTKEIKREPSSAGQSVAEIEAAVQAEQTAKLLERRTAEVDAEREAVIKLQKEVRALKSGLKDDDAVTGSRLYRDLDRRMQNMMGELEQQHSIIGGLQHDLENYRRRGHDLAYQVEQGQHLHAQLQQCDKRLAEVSVALQSAIAERDTAKREALAASAAAPQKTAKELQAMLATLQKQNRGLQAEVKRHRTAAAADEAIKAEASQARAALAERDEAVRLAEARALQQQKAADALRSQAAEAAASGDDLRTMVEVLRALDDGRAGADIRASEAKLRKELQAATSQLNGNTHAAAEARLRDAEAAAAQREADLKRERDALAAKCAALQSQIADLQAQLKAAKEETDVYIGEVEQIGAAYEDMMGQNNRLLAQLADNDRVNSEIVAERVKAVAEAQRAAAEAQQAAGSTRDAQAAAASLQEQVAGMQRQLQVMNEEAAAARQAARHAAQQLDAVQREGRDRDAALAERRSAAEAATAALDGAKRQADEEEERAAREKTKRQRLEDDNRALQAKLDRLRKFDTAGGSGLMLQEENQALLKMTRCSVCDSRQKDRILTKCWHMFCQQCIQRNLETRHRKCPGCGAAFGAADVKAVYLG